MTLKYPEMPYWINKIFNSKFSDTSANHLETERCIDVDSTYIRANISKDRELNAYRDFKQVLINFSTSESEIRINHLEQSNTETTFSQIETEVEKVDIEITNEKSNISKKAYFILDRLLDFSSNLKHIEIKSKRIELILELNEFVKVNKVIIKERFPDILVSILNSL